MPRQVDYGKYFQRILTDATRANIRKGVNSEISHNEAIRVGIKRIPNQDEINKKAAESAKALNHHYIFCSHEIPYWRKCTKCGRDKELAQRNAAMVLKHVGAAIPFFTK